MDGVFIQYYHRVRGIFWKRNTQSLTPDFSSSSLWSVEAAKQNLQWIDATKIFTLMPSTV